MLPVIHSTTILCVRRDGKVAIGGDGQVTVGETVMKANANKVRTLRGGKILAGFAGAAADAFTLFEKFEEKLERYPSNLPRAASSWPRTGAPTACSAGSRLCSSWRTRSMASSSAARAS